MSNVKIRFGSIKLKRDLEKSINKMIKTENEKKEVKKIVSGRGENMRILNETEKEFLKLILDSEHEEYIYHGTYEKFPEYILEQIKKLFAILEECGYAAKTYCWLQSWRVTLTPLGVSYFDREEEYKKMNEKSNININTLNANGSNINFGTVYDSTFNVSNAYQELENAIQNNAKEEDKEELMAIVQEVKDYIENINESKTIGKNTGLFQRIGKHIQNYQWFYQTLVTMIGSAIMNVMGGK